MKKNKFIRHIFVGIMILAMLVQSAFMPISKTNGSIVIEPAEGTETEESTEASTEDAGAGIIQTDMDMLIVTTSVLSPSEEGHVEAWSPVYGHDITVYAGGNVYTQPELLDFTYNDNRAGGVIYCIQPGASITSGDGLLAAAFDDSYLLMTSEQKENIQRVTGYMTYNVDIQSGQTTYNQASLNYYWTYQCLLWYYCGAMSDGDAERTMTENGVGIYSEYTRIRGLMDTYDVIPSYSTASQAAITASYSYELKSNGDGTYSTILHDTTGVLKNGQMQEITCSQSGVTFTQCLADGTASSDGEYIKITSASYIDKNAKATCEQVKKSEYAPFCSNNILLYNKTDQHQNCLSLGLSGTSKAVGYFSVYTEGTGRIQIHKSNAQGEDAGGEATLAGAEYGVYTTEALVWRGTAYEKGSLLATIITDAYGNGCLEQIPLSVYVVRETKASQGFTLDKTEYRAVCDASALGADGVAVAVINSAEAPILTTYEIYKRTLEHGKQDDELIPFSGCTFGIYLLEDLNQNGYTIESGGQYLFSDAAFQHVEAVQTVVTDSEGYAAFENLYCGTYVIRELETGDSNHQTIVPYVVQLPAASGTGNYQSVLSKTIIDDWAYAGLKIVKYDEWTNQQIQLGRASYRLKDAATGEYVSMRIYSPEEDDIITTDVFTSDENGEFYFCDELRAGVYIWEEQETDEICRYELSNLEIIIDNQGVRYRQLDATGEPISESYTDADNIQDESGTDLYCVKAIDRPHSITVNKLDAGGNPLANAVLGIAAADGEHPAMDDNGNYQLIQLPLFEDGALVYDENGSVRMEEAKWVSDGESHIVGYLPVGSYYIVEVTPPDGYVSVAPIPFTIQNEAETAQAALDETDGTDQEKYFELTDLEIDLVISKQDMTTGEELPGAELLLTAEDGTVIDQWISGETSHQIAGDLLKVGNRYTLTEILTPQQYAYANSIEFTVLDTMETQQIVMYDELIQGRIRVYKTGEQLVSAKEDTSEYGVYMSMEFENRPLAGVVYEVYDNEDHLVDTIETQGDGYAETKVLPWGDYYLVETKAPGGIVLSEDKIPVSLDLPANYTEAKYYQEVEAVNDVGTTILNIYKVGETKSVNYGITEIEIKPLQDVVFGVYANEDILGYDGSVVIPRDSCIGYGITDENGVAALEAVLTEGEYYYKELIAPEEYEVQKDCYCFTLKLGNQEQTVVEVNQDEPLVNYLKQTELISPISTSFPSTGDFRRAAWISIGFACLGLLFSFLFASYVNLYIRRKTKKKRR